MLFQDLAERKQLKLIDTITYDSGLVQLVYEVEKNANTDTIE